MIIAEFNRDSHQIRRNNETLFLWFWTLSLLLILKISFTFWDWEEIHKWNPKEKCRTFVPLVVSFPLPILSCLCFSPLSSPTAVSEAWGRAALQLLSSQPVWHHRIAASSLECLFIILIIIIASISSIACVWDHIYTSTYTHCEKNKEERIPSPPPKKLVLQDGQTKGTRRRGGTILLGKAESPDLCTSNDTSQ